MQRLAKPPLRRCAGCRGMFDKKTLVRVVRDAGGAFAADPSGKAAGRGAYVCRSQKCLNAAQKSRGFERSFKAQVPRELYEHLAELVGDT